MTTKIQPCTPLPAVRFTHHFLQHMANVALTHTPCPLQQKEHCTRLTWSDCFCGTRYLTQNPALWDSFHSQLSSRPQPSTKHVPITYLKDGNIFSLSVLPAWHLFQHNSGHLKKKKHYCKTPVYVNTLNSTLLLKKTEGQSICHSQHIVFTSYFKHKTAVLKRKGTYKVVHASWLQLPGV